MKQTLNHWMPRIGRLRRWLVLLMLLCVGLSWYLTSPTAPITTWSLEGDATLGLTMLAPHILVVAQQQHTWLYPTLDPTQVRALPGQGPLDIQGYDGGYQSMATSTDGQWLAIATVARLRPGGHDDVINVWSVADQQLVAQLPVPLSQPDSMFGMLTMSADGRQLAWINRGAHYESNLTIWNQLTQTVTFTQTYSGAAINTDVTLDYVSVKNSHALGFYTSATILEVQQLYDGVVRYQIATTEYPRSLSLDGTRLILEGDGVFLVRRVEDGRLLQRIPYHTFAGFFGDEQAFISVSGDSRYALVGCTYSYSSSNGFSLDLPLLSNEVVMPAELWDLPTGQVVQRFDTQLTGVKWMVLSPDGQYAVIANDSTLRVFQVSPQPPFVQTGCMLIAFLLALLLFWQWLWARRNVAQTLP